MKHRTGWIGALAMASASLLGLSAQSVVATDIDPVAVRVAREDVWLRFPDVNTWGAYQCYGDPDFRFHRDGSGAQRVWPDFSTPHELVAELENLAADFRAERDRLDVVDVEPEPPRRW